VHGITDTMVEYAPPFRRIVPDLLEHMKEADLAGFNIIRFDIPLLKNEFQRAGHNWDLEGVRIVDAQIIFHKMEPRDLSAALRFYCGRILEGPMAPWPTPAPPRCPSQPARALSQPAPGCGGPGCRVPSAGPAVRGWSRRFFWRNGEATFNFGNRRGQTLREVAQNSPGYLQWMLDSNFSSEVKGWSRMRSRGPSGAAPAARGDRGVGSHRLAVRTRGNPPVLTLIRQ